MLTVMANRKVIRIYASFWVMGYLVLYFFLKNYLPEEYFRDSVTIQQMAENLVVGNWGGAFHIAAVITRVLPAWALDAIVITIGSGTLWIIATSVQTFRGMILIVPILAPIIVLDLMAFGKEVFVIPLTLIISLVATKTHSTLKAFLVICSIYLLYGVYFREYYLLILLVFMLYMITIKSHMILRFGYVIVLVVILALIPSDIYTMLQGPRDQINFITGMGAAKVRTAIYNPVAPDNGYHFVINYLYTIIRINFPILFAQTANEFVLLFNVLIYGRLAWIGIKRRPVDAPALLPWLFLSHITILTIFEPDLGSYFRHFSSTILYLIPTLRRAEQAYVNHFIAQRSQKSITATAAIADPMTLEKHYPG